MSIAKEARELYLQGYDMPEIRKELNASESTVRHALKRAGYSTEPIPRTKEYIFDFTIKWNSAVARIKRAAEHIAEIERDKRKIVIY